MLLVEVPWVTFEGGSRLVRQRLAHSARQRHTGLGQAPIINVKLGLWDAYAQITPLQLTVALSMAVEVDESHVRVVDEGDHFFGVKIKDEGGWLVDEINSSDGDFMNTLNAQASVFGAKLVISHSASANLGLSNATEQSKR